MLQIKKGQFNLMLEDIQKNAIPLSLNISKETEEKALKECDEYIETGNKNINDMTPLTVYYIISKLSEDEQINFIKENINYIRNHDEKIFLYNMLWPKSLSYYLSFNVIKEIHEIDEDIFNKLIKGDFENVCQKKNNYMGCNHSCFYFSRYVFHDNLRQQLRD